MVIYTRYISPEAEICTSFFITIVEQLPNGTSETVEKVNTNYLESNNIPLSSFVGFGTDGAAV